MTIASQRLSVQPVELLANTLGREALPVRPDIQLLAQESHLETINTEPVPGILFPLLHPNVVSDPPKLLNSLLEQSGLSLQEFLTDLGLLDSNLTLMDGIRVDSASGEYYRVPSLVSQQEDGLLRLVDYLGVGSIAELREAMFYGFEAQDFLFNRGGVSGEELRRLGFPVSDEEVDEVPLYPVHNLIGLSSVEIISGSNPEDRVIKLGFFTLYQSEEPGERFTYVPSGQSVTEHLESIWSIDHMPRVVR